MSFQPAGLPPEARNAHFAAIEQRQIDRVIAGLPAFLQPPPLPSTLEVKLWQMTQPPPRVSTSSQVVPFGNPGWLESVRSEHDDAFREAAGLPPFTSSPASATGDVTGTWRTSIPNVIFSPPGLALRTETLGLDRLQPNLDGRLPGSTDIAAGWSALTPEARELVHAANQAWIFGGMKAMYRLWEVTNFQPLPDTRLRLRWLTALRDRGGLSDPQLQKLNIEIGRSSAEEFHHRGM